MNRIGDGLRMLRMSWRIVRTTPSLLLLPAAGVLAFAVAAAAMFATEVAYQQLVSGNLLPALAGWLGFLLAAYVVAMTLTALFGGAAVAVAQARLRGVTIGFGGGLSQAWQHRSSLLKWTVITTSVGLFLGHEENRNNAFVQAVAGGMDLAWTTATFLVVPVILAENTSATGALGRAKNLFAGRWGEELSGYIGFNVILAIAFTLVVLGAIAVALSTTVATGLIVGLSLSAVLLVFASAMRCTFASVVYHSASEPLPVASYA